MASLKVSLQCRICRRIGGGVLLSILAIEAAILIPSYKNYERDLLLRLESSGRAEITATYRSTGHSRERDLLIMGRALIQSSGAQIDSSHVRGGRLHRADGSLIGSFGEVPALTLEAVQSGARQTRRSADGMYYDVVWPAEETGLPFTVAARLDASWIAPELQAFVWRIFGLVLLISVFVSIVTMAIFGRSVLLPLLRLRTSLVRAHQDPTHADRYALAETRADELGELMDAADQLLHRVSSRLESQETQLSETTEHLMAVLNNSVASIITMNSEGVVTSFNPAAEKLFGYRAEQVISRNVSMLMRDRDRATHDGYLANYKTGGETDVVGRTRMVVGRHMGGHTIPLELSVGKMMVRGESYFVGFLTDITERVAAEEQLRQAHDTLEQRVRDRTERLEGEITAHKQTEKELEERVVDLQIAKAAIENQGVELVKLAEDLSTARDQTEAESRAKSEFLASMSHELRTPLNAIIDFSEILSTEALGPIGSVKYRDYAGDIHESGQHLLDLINDILDLAKIESGQDELREEDIDIPRVTRSVIRLVGQRAEKSGVSLELELSDPSPDLRGDERRLKQILVNLLSNAVKFTEAGGRVILKIWCHADSGHVFQVIDTGIGIAREDIPKALSQYGQVDSPLSRQHAGTGLGLPLTKSLVELHGGSLDLQSEVGVGTTVTVRFPAARIVKSPTQATPCSAA